jgi:hypothetical protein
MRTIRRVAGWRGRGDRAGSIAARIAAISVRASAAVGAVGTPSSGASHVHVAHRGSASRASARLAASSPSR